MIKILFKNVGLILFILSSLNAQDAQEIIRKTENALRGKSSMGEMEMKVSKKEWTRTIKFRFWEKGKDKGVVVILEPAKERGIATLKIKNNVWNYLPSIERTIKLPFSMMNESWMGSHFTNDDLVRESSLERDYNAKIIKQDNERYYLELIPKPEAMVVWGKIEVEIDKKTYLPLKAYYYNEKGERIRSLVYSEIKKAENRYFPFLWVLYPEDKPGEKTEIRVIDIKFDVPIPENIFSLRHLKDLIK